MRTAPWLLVQFVTVGDDRPIAGIRVHDAIHALPSGWPQTVLELLDDWSVWQSRLRALDPESLSAVHDARLVAPITYPRKVLCAGANYYDHAEEMGTETPDPTAAPFFFLKPPTTTIVGPSADVELPARSGANVDWEAELGVVIADRCKSVPLEEARSHVAGYLVANDLSARGLFSRPGAVFPPFAWDWLAHKGLDGFCPVGPGIVPWWFLEDADHLRLTLTVNGVTTQDSNTSNLVVGIDGLISGASELITLEPGDLILTGTPAGVGMPKGTFLSAGDVVAVQIEGIGRIENRMVAA
ncbi:fumarylacetoacetate hydrolase family protein [uncultured Microbacterium sp.]|uniref:fumarylacetoacetate hydrolase family protein n=1 Tax=uncultured Microbacterium sp. TaxID=191216 RepID=UPI0035CB8298